MGRRTCRRPDGVFRTVCTVWRQNRHHGVSSYASAIVRFSAGRSATQKYWNAATGRFWQIKMKIGGWRTSGESLRWRILSSDCYGHVTTSSDTQTPTCWRATKSCWRSDCPVRPAGGGAGGCVVRRAGVARGKKRQTVMGQRPGALPTPEWRVEHPPVLVVPHDGAARDSRRERHEQQEHQSVRKIVRFHQGEPGAPT